MMGGFGGRELSRRMEGFEGPEGRQGPPRWMEGFEGREGRQGPPQWMDGFEGREGRERPQGVDGFQGRQRPEMKRPAQNVPPRKAEAGDRSIEARLTALEDQQAAILVALQEQQAAVMAALQQTNDLFNARLAALERPQGGYEPLARQPRPERGPRELSSRIGRNPWHSEDDPQDDDRD